ncbi:DUF1223 domain-containing protein [Stappia sp. F7233]|uniref:DUF1223 domain-containing protein n=1 Tax=Stappia albiluteola TaxID=2758565 RepID=A0A839AG40_9HYPH|nr:DUF1223 domain-containing protein [Stappia albiluteola]MBA5778631.1 DUF1223 domain-containing protein [Stappia albiluteola]
MSSVFGTTSVQAGETAVLELFTSQGCSSCPPADKLLQAVAGQPGVVALSFPVDYWDYLGWKDTLASPAYSARQRAYAERRGDRSVYTPQIVVNGGEHVVGSDVRSLAAAVSKLGPMPCQVSLKPQGDVVEIHVDGDLPKGTKAAMVFFLFVDDHETVQIGRGENTGRSVTYTNVVRDMRAVGMWKGGEAVYSLPASELSRLSANRYAVIVQPEVNGRPGPIIGAAIH